MTTKKTNRPRGRPSILNREVAVRTALSLFWKKGYDAVGIAELSEAMEVNPPTLYSAFGSKLGVFEAAVEKYTTEDGAFVEPILLSARTVSGLASALLNEAAKAYTHSVSKPGCLVLHGASNNENSEARTLTLGYVEETYKAIASRLQALGCKNPNDLSAYLIASMTGLSERARMGAPRKELLRVAELQSQAVLRGEENNEQS